jgi:predicted GTPase
MTTQQLLTIPSKRLHRTEAYQTEFKILIVGEPNVGKSVLFRKIFGENANEFDHMTVRVYGTNVRLTVWDTPGKTPQVVSETADLALLLFDIARPDTMLALK